MSCLERVNENGLRGARGERVAKPDQRQQSSRAYRMYSARSSDRWYRTFTSPVCRDGICPSPLCGFYFVRVLHRDVTYDVEFMGAKRTSNERMSLSPTDGCDDVMTVDGHAEAWTGLRLCEQCDAFRFYRRTRVPFILFFNA